MGHYLSELITGLLNMRPICRAIYIVQWLTYARLGDPSSPTASVCDHLIHGCNDTTDNQGRSMYNRTGPLVKGLS